MSYYAANDIISHDPIPGGVEITEQQYNDALTAILSGSRVSIDDGFQIITTQQEVVDPGEVSPEQNLENLKVLKNSDLTQDCIIAISEGFEFQGKVIASDQMSRDALTRSLVAAQNGGAELKSWFAKDGTEFPLPDKESVDELAKTFIQFTSAMQDKLTKLCMVVNAATTPEEITAASWNEIDQPDQEQ